MRWPDRIALQKTVGKELIVLSMDAEDKFTQLDDIVSVDLHFLPVGEAVCTVSRRESKSGKVVQRIYSEYTRYMLVSY